MNYAHLKFQRETPLTERHPGKPPRTKFEGDIKAHGRALGTQFAIARISPNDQVGGFDQRKLLKIQLRAGEKIVPPFERIRGIEIVSQERHSVVLAFATDAGLAEVERRLSTLARDGVVTRKELFYVIEGFDHWTVDDRTGAALREQGLQGTPPFSLDIELWPQERADRRSTMLQAFLDWIRTNGIQKLDVVEQPSLVMIRLRCKIEQLQQLIRHRDVRTVDLPPRLGLSVQLLLTDINAFPEMLPSPQGVPAVAVLDSGITTGHPLIAQAMGDALGFLEAKSSTDAPPHWHGTSVAGIALHGDIQAGIAQLSLVPRLRLFSGKVFEDDDKDQTEFVEKAVEQAVRDLREQYGCRVFNLSYGDQNKVYDGRHLRGLAYTLDRLTRELNVLFVVPTGNLSISDLPDNAIDQYPSYLFGERHRLLDPATALNVLTVGGLSQSEATRSTQRYPDTIESRPIAREGQPFPLTRCGPSMQGAIKPDLVAHAGNLALRRSGGGTDYVGLGVLSLNGGFATGPAFKEDIGTSYAAPQVAHQAALLLAELPTASSQLLRALMGAHARWPSACEPLLNASNTPAGRDQLLRAVGYGRVSQSALYRSLDDTVTLIAEDKIENNRHHFFELPLPQTFWSRGRRSREISVALAYSPEVKTTRMDYRRAKLWFHLTLARDLDQVTKAYRRNREEGMGERSTGRWLSNKARKNGTLQVSRWCFKDPPKAEEKVVVVITRQDSAWSTPENQQQPEPYALAVVLADREQAGVQLYIQVSALLQARLQQRARARV